MRIPQPAAVEALEQPAPVDLDLIRTRCTSEVEGADFYAELARNGNFYGPAFQNVRRLWKGDQELIAYLEESTELESQASAYQIHPAFLDACMHVLPALVEHLKQTFILVGIDQVQVFDFPANLHAGATRRPYAALIGRKPSESKDDVQHWCSKRGLEAAADLIDQDWERMVTFYNYPKQQWQHLRTTNPVESPFSALRLRTDAARRFKKVANARAVIWKMLLVAEKRFRRLKAPHLMKDVYQGAQYVNGVPVNPVTQEKAA